MTPKQIKALVDKVGGRARLAALLSTDLPQLSRWITGKKRPSRMSIDALRRVAQSLNNKEAKQ